MNRRHFLLLAGGGVVVSAAVLGGFAITREPTRALQPWRGAGQYSDPRMRALSYAILAPNPHNLQPWLVELSGDAELLVRRDRRLLLPHTDPFERQLTIGMGCFLELLAIAASADGYEVQLRPFPAGADGPIAWARFERAEVQADPLFDAILSRRSCKEPFAERRLSAAQLGALSDLGETVDDPARVADLRQLATDAFEVEYRTHRTLKESVDLMRFGKGAIETSPDGIDMGGTMFELMHLAGLLTPDTLLDPDTEAWRQGLAIYRDLLAATPHFILLRTSGNSRLAQIEAGRRWARLNLLTTRMGLALHPVSQALQEYPEMQPHYDRLHAEYATPNETVQMLGRLGYGPTVPPSPRWPLATKLT